MWPPIIFLHWEEVGFTVLTLGGWLDGVREGCVAFVAQAKTQLESSSSRSCDGTNFAKRRKEFRGVDHLDSGVDDVVRGDWLEQPLRQASLSLYTDPQTISQSNIQEYFLDSVEWESLLVPPKTAGACHAGRPPFGTHTHSCVNLLPLASLLSLGKLNSRPLVYKMCRVGAPPPVSISAGRRPRTRTRQARDPL